MKLAWYQLIDNKIRQSIGPYTVSQNIDHLTERGGNQSKQYSARHWSCNLLKTYSGSDDVFSQALENCTSRCKHKVRPRHENDTPRSGLHLELNCGGKVQESKGSVDVLSRVDPWI